MAKEKAVKAGLSFADKVKKGAKAAKKAASDVERGVATRVGKKEGVEIAKGAKTKNLGAGFGLTQKGKGARMATKAQRDDVVKSGRRRFGAGAVGAAGAATILSGDGKDKSAKKEKKFNVGVSKGGVPFKEAFKHYRGKGNKTFTWNGKKYTTDLKSEVKPKAKVEKEKPKKKGFRPFGGAIRRALLGKDEKFGGDKGAIDFIRRKKKEDKKKPTSPASGASRRPGGKAMGGMMKSKMASKGGKMGGKMAPGMMGGGMAGGDRIGNMLRSRMTNTSQANKRAAALAKGDKQIAMRQRAPGMKDGGSAKKTAKGYSKGGVARKGKPRGVGVALRGYGKALK